jgi:hypothetical protein
MRGIVAATAVAFAIASPHAALAGDFSANAGAIEVVGEPGGDHLGVYPYIAVSQLIPAGKVALIPSLGVEWSPEFGHWGFVPALTADWSLGRVGLDLNVALIHDQQDHHWGDAAFLAGGGPGMSIYLGKWTVSSYVSWFSGLNVSGGAVVPGLNVSRSL